MKRTICVILSLIIMVCTFPVSIGESVSYNKIVNASCAIIIRNEGEYTSVVKNDVGAVSLGILGWHATRALSLLKEICAKNPVEAKNLLGTSFYEEIQTSTSWEGRIFSQNEADRSSILLGTSFAIEVQNSNAADDVGEYVSHGQRLGITDPRALVFFADIENQNGYTGAADFYSHTVYQTGHSSPTLSDLYFSSSQDSRRTRTYNFCASIVWSDYANGFYKPRDTESPKVTNAKVVGTVTSAGYTLSFMISDNVGVSTVYTATFLTESGSDNAVWQEFKPSGSMSVYVDLSTLGNRYGKYTTIIYAVDEAGNYGYQIIGPVEVADDSQSKKVNVSTAVDKTLIRPDEEFTCMSMGYGGSGEFLFRFELYRDDILIDERDWSTYRLYNITPAVHENISATYKIKSFVKDKSSGETSFTFTPEVKLCRQISVSTLTVDKKELHLGESVKYTVNATGGEGGFQYKFAVYCDGKIEYESKLSGSSSLTYTPKKGGNYKCTVTVKDKKGQTVNKNLPAVTVLAPIKLSNAKKSRTYAVSGMTVKFWADSTGGTGTKTYIYSIYVDDKKQDEIISQENSLNYTVQIPGIYKIKMSVRDIENSEANVTISGLRVDAKPMKGDANLNGKVDVIDARFVLRVSARLQEATENFEYLCDVDSSGKVTATDARILLRYSAKIGKLPE